jgi:hypothetical protein
MRKVPDILVVSVRLLFVAVGVTLIFHSSMSTKYLLVIRQNEIVQTKIKACFALVNVSRANMSNGGVKF